MKNIYVRFHISMRYIWFVIVLQMLDGLCFCGGISDEIYSIRKYVFERGGVIQQIENRYLMLTNIYTGPDDLKRIYQEIINMYSGLDGTYSKLVRGNDVNEKIVFYVGKIMELSCDVKDTIKNYYILGESICNTQRSSKGEQLDNKFEAMMAFVKGLYVIFKNLEISTRQPLPHIRIYNIDNMNNKEYHEMREKSEEERKIREYIELQNFLLEYKEIYIRRIKEICPNAAIYDDKELKRIVKDIIDNSVNVTNYFK